MLTSCWCVMTQQCNRLPCCLCLAVNLQDNNLRTDKYKETPNSACTINTPAHVSAVDTASMVCTHQVSWSHVERAPAFPMFPTGVSMSTVALADSGLSMGDGGWARYTRIEPSYVFETYVESCLSLSLLQVAL